MIGCGCIRIINWNITRNTGSECHMEGTYERYPLESILAAGVYTNQICDSIAAGINEWDGRSVGMAWDGVWEILLGKLFCGCLVQHYRELVMGRVGFGE